jgi:menaquinol-cytochrome c reductase iron-sulfur subunit
MLTPLVRPRAKQAGQFIRVASVGDLETGVPKRVDVVSSAVDGWSVQADAVVGSAWLVKQADGRISAFSTICPHLGCPIASVGTEGFRCPCHDSFFKADGSSTKGPSPRAMDMLEVQVDNGNVLLRYVRYKQGVADLREV